MSIVRRGGITSGVDRAWDGITSTGLQFPDRPKVDYPEIPEDVTSLDDAELMSLFGRYTSWYGFATVECAKAAAMEKAAEEEFGLENAKSMVREWEGATEAKVTISRARRDIDPVVVRNREILLERYASRKVLESMVKALELQQAFVSREITRRTSNTADARGSRFST